MKKNAGTVHINATAQVEEPKKSRHDDFFAKFENAEMKQEAPLPVKTEPLVVPVEKEEPAAPKTNGVDLDALTVNLGETQLSAPKTVTKTTPKVAKVTKN